jgi:hypothetical protein
MTHERDIERLLDHWFSDGPNEAPDRVIDAVADRIGRQSQRPAWRLDWRHTTMTPTLKFGAAIAAVIVIGIVGFGLFRDGGDSAVGAPDASPTPNPTLAPSSAPPAPTPAASSPSPAVGVAGACDLMTTDEAGEALHIAALVTSGSLGDVATPTTPSMYCGFDSGGTTLFVLAYDKENGGNSFPIWKRQPGVEAVSGLGDDAAWNPTQTTLYILKGDRLVTIEPVDGPSPTLTLEAAKAIGAFVVPRM